MFPSSRENASSFAWSVEVTRILFSVQCFVAKLKHGIFCAKARGVLSRADKNEIALLPRLFALSRPPFIDDSVAASSTVRSVDCGIRSSRSAPDDKCDVPVCSSSAIEQRQQRDQCIELERTSSDRVPAWLWVEGLGGRGRRQDEVGRRRLAHQPVRLWESDRKSASRGRGLLVSLPKASSSAPVTRLS